MVALILATTITALLKTVGRLLSMAGFNHSQMAELSAINGAIQVCAFVLSGRSEPDQKYLETTGSGVRVAHNLQNPRPSPPKFSGEGFPY